MTALDGRPRSCRAARQRLGVAAHPCPDRRLPQVRLAGRRRARRPRAADGDPADLAQGRQRSNDAPGRSRRRRTGSTSTTTSSPSTTARCSAASRTPAFIMVFSIAGTMLIGSMTAYAIDRFRFRFRRVIVGLFLLATLVPAVTTQVATFQVVNCLGLFNTRWAPDRAVHRHRHRLDLHLRAVHADHPGLARRGGEDRRGQPLDDLLADHPAQPQAGHRHRGHHQGHHGLQRLLHPLPLHPDDNLQTISTSLQRFKGPFGAHWEDISAGAILVIIPTLIIFLLLQRFIYNGFTSGSVK